MKKRLIKDINEAAKVESIEVNVQSKLSRSHRWLRFVKRFRYKIDKKLLLIWCLLLFLFIIFCFSFYLGNATIPNNERSSIVDADYVLPIGTATNEDYYITRPNGRDDGGVVRVMFVIASNRTDQTLCYAVASAYFTNIPIVVVGFDKKNYKNVNKPKMFISTLERTHMQNSDVVIALDSDIMFTGLDYLSFIDKFIKLSPANLNELDAKAIRTGQALPPVLYGSEGGCWGPQAIAKRQKECNGNYNSIEEVHNKYSSTLTDSIKPFFNYDDNNLQFLNSGTSIHRVWAMRKVFAAFHKFVSANIPLGKGYWYSDQSVFAKLYLELRLWEIEQDYFRKHTDELRRMSNEYGLYAGLIGLDLKSEFSATVWNGKKDQDFELITDLWRSNISERLIVKSFYKKNVSTLVEKLYSSSNTKELFTERKLTRSYSNVHSVTIAPPLLSIIPRHINGKDKPAERVYPWLAHYAEFRKNERYKNALNYMQWSLPMMFDKEEWKRGKQYVMSMPIELWTGNDEKLRLRYGDVCEKHPFNKFER